MLKIKDDIEAKELENYGFVLKRDRGINEIYYSTYTGLMSKHLRVDKKGKIYGCDLHLIFDLIQAGLVEKVEEE